MNDSQRILEALLTREEQRWQALPMAEWFAEFKQVVVGYDNSIDRALLAGRLSANVGFAFAGAYQSAIEALFEFDEPLLASVCITEAAGNHPRAIKTRLYSEDGQLYLSGEKSFVSGAEDAGIIYVACRDERFGDGLDSLGRPLIKLLVLKTDIEGLTIEAMPALGFVPELSHGKLVLDKLAIDEACLLEGDGYLRYVKAFRTYEDLHVCAAIAAYRLAEASAGGWGRAYIEKHIALILSLREIRAMALNSSVAHIALSACRCQLNELIALSDECFERGNPEAYANWQRDSGLLKVANKAHEVRTQKAWAAIQH